VTSVQRNTTMTDQVTINVGETDSPTESLINIESPLILLVEDNESNTLMLSSYLMAKGYRMVLAQNGYEAIQLNQEHQPDIILMDIQMPGMDGFEAIRRIRNSPHHQVPILALTALAMTGDRTRCLEAGANDYLSKPVKLKELNLTIQQWLKLEKKEEAADLN
jgi:CheY-like chemotaxis protein